MSLDFIFNETVTIPIFPNLNSSVINKNRFSKSANKLLTIEKIVKI